MKAPAAHPYHPLIYVRGFAATQGEIEETVADPYMGFNVGSTKTRVAWTGDVRRFFFESPLVRLMSDHGYEDVFVEGDDLVAATHERHPIPYRSIIIYRYYDEASEDFGSGETPPIEHFAQGLSDLILGLRDKICANPNNAVTQDDFRVHLVAHSMGGLVCRAFLQNPKLGSDTARQAVDKVFTYATPHNGIDMRVVRNVPGWLTFGDINNFNRERMAKYLGLAKSDDVSVVKGFPPERIFNLVGTNPRDYTAAGGLSSWAVGEASDGLLCIQNATTHGPGSDGEDITSPRAFVHRSHSGHYGIVNSEEGYQNLTRFLFGELRVDGILEVDDISLPMEVQKAKDESKTIRASYQFEVVVSVRGCQWQMTRREVRENSAIFRSFGDLFPERDSSSRSTGRSRAPHLFSVFLDGHKSVKASRSMSFAVDLKVLVPDYEVDGVMFLKRHYEGGFILRRLILIEVFPDTKALGQCRIKYGFQEMNPGKPGILAETHAIGGGDESPGLAFRIPLEQKTRPGLRGTLLIKARQWR
ncbi:esterase/lipase family protein [Pistricoccus aurantiacus]|uniref:esterase/lipase family protein n=1 Tax=Pistricoccus aurantiacus TaxID=1883414 RepID=UPI00362A505D